MTNPISTAISADGLVGVDEAGRLWLGRVESDGEICYSSSSSKQDVRGMTCAICCRGWEPTVESFEDQSFWRLIDEVVHESCLIRHIGFAERAELGAAIVSARIPHTRLKPIWNGYYAEGYDPKRDRWCLKPWYWTRVITDFDVDPPDDHARSRAEALQRLGHRPDLISITVGWRTKVIALEVRGEGRQTLPWWSDAERAFAEENVTKSFDEKSVELHAYGYEKLREYLSQIATIGNLRRPGH